MSVTANWLAAAKKCPTEPIVVVEIEKGTADAVYKRSESDWNASTSQVECEVFARGDGTGGIRPKLYTYAYNSPGITWENGPAWATYKSPVLNTPVIGYFESLRGNLKTIFLSGMGVSLYFYSPATVQGLQVPITEQATTFQTTTTVTYPIGHGMTSGTALGTAPIPAGTSIAAGEISYSGTHKVGFAPFTAEVLTLAGVSGGGASVADIVTGPLSDADFRLTYRSAQATFTTAVFDMGSTPTGSVAVNLLASTPGGSTVTINAWSSPDNTTWTNRGAVADGGLIVAARYYKFDVTLTCSVDSPGNLKVPELYEIRLVPGSSTYEYYSTSTAVAVPGFTVHPHLKSVSGISSKIGLKDKPTVGDLSLTFNWLKEGSAMAVGSQRKRSIRAYVGFAGLAWADYAPYFTGVWDSVTVNGSKREITLKVRDIWKLFKRKIPNVQFSEGKATTEDYEVNTHIIDAIQDVAEKTLVPARFVDDSAFTALKAAQYATGNWSVYRRFEQQETSDDLMNELAVSAGLFLVPGHDGKLRPVHYDSTVAGAPAATLDAGRYTFSEVKTDFGETCTQVRVYYGLIAGKSGGSVEDFGNVDLFPNRDAEVDRDERVPLEWKDKWGLSAGDSAKTGTAITKLADRLMSWYCPTTTVSGKPVAVAAYQVTVSGLPLWYFDLTPGQVVAVDNLRLPAPIDQWGGFSSGAKMMIMAKRVDAKNWTISLDLRQVGTVTYRTATTWATYTQDTPPVVLPAAGIGGLIGPENSNDTVSITGEQVFKYLAGASVPVNTSIVLTATLTGSLTTYDWEYWTGAAWANLSGTQNAATYALAHDNAAWGSATALRVRCLSGAVWDEIGIVKIYDGSPVTVILTNEAHTLPTTTAGVVTYTGSGTSIQVFKGTTELNSVTGTPGAGQFAVSAAVTTGTITIGAQTVTGNPAVFADHSAMATDKATITYTINVENTLTMSKVQSLAKSWQGSTGAAGSTGPQGPAGANGADGAPGPGLYRGTTPPGSPVAYQLWFNTSTADGTYYANTQYQYVGGTWVPTSPRGTKIDANGIYTGTLTATQVNAVAIDAASITTGTITGRTIRTAAAGERVTLHDTGSSASLWYYDSTGTARVKIGSTTDATAYMTIYDTAGTNKLAAEFYVSGTSAGLAVRNARGGTPPSLTGLVDCAIIASAYAGSGVHGKSSSTSLTYAGVYGDSSAACPGVRGNNSSSGAGVYGTSTSGNCIHGYSTSTNTAIRGENTSGGYGVHGSSSTSSGVRGTSSSGYGVEGVTTTTVAVRGYSGSLYGVEGVTDSSSYPGVRGSGNGTTGGIGVEGYSANGYGVVCGYSGSGRGPLRIQPSASTSAPTHSADVGTLFVTSAGVLYINTSGSTTWAKVGAQ